LHTHASSSLPSSLTSEDGDVCSKKKQHQTPNTKNPTTKNKAQ
jgi:hypothetical protein